MTGILFQIEMQTTKHQNRIPLRTAFNHERHETHENRKNVDVLFPISAYYGQISDYWFSYYYLAKSTQVAMISL
jgi:hypothetical protein